jgi:hypothetical protein
VKDYVIDGISIADHRTGHALVPKRTAHPEAVTKQIWRVDVNGLFMTLVFARTYDEAYSWAKRTYTDDLESVQPALKADLDYVVQFGGRIHDLSVKGGW